MIRRFCFVTVLSFLLLFLALLNAAGEGNIPGDPWGLTFVKVAGVYDSQMPDPTVEYDPDAGSYTITAAGHDIWDSQDGCAFAYMAVSGDFSVSVRLDDPGGQWPNAWSKAGLMVRQDDTPSSPYVCVVATRNYGVRLQWRQVSGGQAADTGFSEPPSPLPYPIWLKVVRRGNILSGWSSYDGASWVNFVFNVHSIAFNDPLLVGICLTSHDQNQSALATFGDLKSKAPDEQVLESAVGFLGYYYNMPIPHPDIGYYPERGGYQLGMVEQTLPLRLSDKGRTDIKQFDWFDDKYLSFTKTNSDLRFGYSFFPVDEGLPGDPNYFSVHWVGALDVLTRTNFLCSMASDDDSWLFVDGNLVLDLGLTHAMDFYRTEIVTLPTGRHQLDVFFAERCAGGSGFQFAFMPTKCVTIWREDFDAYKTTQDVMSAGWTIVNGSGSWEAAWRLWDTDGPYLVTEPPSLRAMNHKYMISDSDLDPDADMDEQLISPMIDCTGRSKVRLQFNENFRPYDDPEHQQVAQVDIRALESSSGWSEWVSLLKLDSTSVYFTEKSDAKNMDISSIADGHKIQIRFYFREAKWDWWFAVDEIMVTGEPTQGSVLVYPSQSFKQATGLLSLGARVQDTLFGPVTSGSFRWSLRNSSGTEISNGDMSFNAAAGQWLASRTFAAGLSPGRYTVGYSITANRGRTGYAEGTLIVGGLNVTVAGVITDPADGSPLSGALVAMLEAGGPNGLWTLVNAEYGGIVPPLETLLSRLSPVQDPVTTGSDGAYRWLSIPPGGAYVIVVAKPGYVQSYTPSFALSASEGMVARSLSLPADSSALAVVRADLIGSGVPGRPSVEEEANEALDELAELIAEVARRVNEDELFKLDIREIGVDLLAEVYSATATGIVKGAVWEAGLRTVSEEALKKSILQVLRNRLARWAVKESLKTVAKIIGNLVEEAVSGQSLEWTTSGQYRESGMFEPADAAMAKAHAMFEQNLGVELDNAFSIAKARDAIGGLET